MGRMQPINFKPITRSVLADTSALCYVKIQSMGPLVTTDAGAEITTATVQVTSNDLTLLVNTAAETVIGTYTGNSGADNTATFGDTNCSTIQELLNVLNGVATGQSSVIRRWRAGLGDFRPQFVIGTGDGLATAAANAMLGRGSDGLICLADSSALASANTLAIGLGTDRAREGGGQNFPDHFETDYTSTTGGVKTPVRSSARRIEDQPGQAGTQVVLTDLQVGALFATTKIATVYDDAGNILKSWALGAATAIPGGPFTAENPAVAGPVGSPLFIEITGTGGFTDGTCTASGYTRIA